MYAIFMKSLVGTMVKLSECKLVDYEYQAQWYCIKHPEYTYKLVG